MNKKELKKVKELKDIYDKMESYYKSEQFKKDFENNNRILNGVQNYIERKNNNIDNSIIYF